MDVEEKGKYIPKQYMIATDGNAQVLLHEQEKEKPYKYLPWEYVVGRGLGRGQVEDGFESQMWTNDAVMAQKNAMDLAGKVVITSNSHELQGNALTDIDNGTIVPLQDNGFFNSTMPTRPFGTLDSCWRAFFPALIVLDGCDVEPPLVRSGRLIVRCAAVAHRSPCFRCRNTDASALCATPQCSFFLDEA